MLRDRGVNLCMDLCMDLWMDIWMDMDGPADSCISPNKLPTVSISFYKFLMAEWLGRVSGT